MCSKNINTEAVLIKTEFNQREKKNILLMCTQFARNLLAPTSIVW